MKEKLLEALFESYYAETPLTAEFSNAKLDLCEDNNQEAELNDAIKAEAKMAYKAAFNATLALMGGVK